MTEKPELTQKNARPLSPHLQVYNLPMTARMSISHRFTGIVLSAGLVIISAMLIAAASFPDTYTLLMSWAATDYGTAFLFLWSLALFYHLCNGVRHLFWDMVLLFKLRNARIANWIVIFAALGLTLSTWYCARHFGGAAATAEEVTINER